jgi:hypothetical protein
LKVKSQRSKVKRDPGAESPETKDQRLETKG